MENKNDLNQESICLPEVEAEHHNDVKQVGRKWIRVVKRNLMPITVGFHHVMLEAGFA